MSLTIRPTTEDDVSEVVRVFDVARAFMRASGNFTQWTGSYPGAADVRTDMARDASYVVEQGGRVVGTFAFLIGEEPTYKVIEGAWRSDAPYGTVHRIASDGSAHGVARACFEFCAQRMTYLRVDTHEDNKPMQAAALSFGLRPCGVVHMADGTPRIAFDWLREE